MYWKDKNKEKEARDGPLKKPFMLRGQQGVQYWKQALVERLLTIPTRGPLLQSVNDQVKAFRPHFLGKFDLKNIKMVKTTSNGHFKIRRYCKSLFCIKYDVFVQVQALEQKIVIYLFLYGI